MLVMQVYFKANRKAGQRMLRVFLCFCTDPLAWDSGVSFAPDFSATLKKKAENEYTCEKLLRHRSRSCSRSSGRSAGQPATKALQLPKRKNRKTMTSP
jgi:hypothetical protein